MSPHIDVFVTDWVRGEQRVVARVRLNDECKIEVEEIDPGYRDLVWEPIDGNGIGRELDPQQEPTEFFKRLPAALTGSYIGATEPHEAGCPFETPDHSFRPIKTVGGLS